MKICFISSGFPPSKGGVATFIYEWVWHAADALPNASITVLAFGNPHRRAYRLRDNVFVRTLRTRNPFVMGVLIGWYVFRSRWSWVHGMNLFPVGFWTVLWCRVARIPSMITFYGTDACAPARPIVERLKAWTIRASSRALTISTATKTRVERKFHIPAGSIRVIYAGAPEAVARREQKEESPNEDVRERLGIAPGACVVLSVAQLVKRKGLDMLIQAVADIPNDGVFCIIAGGGPEESSLRSRIQELGQERRIFLAGKVPSVEPYYRAADICVLNSWEEGGDVEGLGLVLIEAQMRGIPVIGSASGGIPETFHNGVSGMLVPEKDTEALREAISTLARDPFLRKKMGEEGKRFVAKRFSWKKAMEEYIPKEKL